jgi:hypothetical protein
MRWPAARRSSSYCLSGCVACMYGLQASLLHQTPHTSDVASCKHSLHCMCASQHGHHTAMGQHMQVCVGHNTTWATTQCMLPAWQRCMPAAVPPPIPAMAAPSWLHHTGTYGASSPARNAHSLTASSSARPCRQDRPTLRSAACAPSASPPSAAAAPPASVTWPPSSCSA